MAEEASPQQQQQQQVHTTTLSEIEFYGLSERDKKVGLIPVATAKGDDVLLFKSIIEWTMLLSSM